MKIEWYQLDPDNWVTLRNFNGFSYYIRRSRTGVRTYRFTVLRNSIGGRFIVEQGIKSFEIAKSRVEIEIAERSRKK